MVVLDTVAREYPDMCLRRTSRKIASVHFGCIFVMIDHLLLIGWVGILKEQYNDTEISELLVMRIVSTFWKEQSDVRVKSHSRVVSG